MLENVGRGLQQWWSSLQTGWWDQLPAFQRGFWYIAIPFTVVFLIQLFMTFVGMGGDEVEGFDEGAGDLVGFRLVTVRNFIIFFTVFGWTGIALSHGTRSETEIIIVAIAVGLVVMIAVAGLFYLIMRLTESGSTRLTNAQGRTGEVYIPIPGHREGLGKIHVTFQGSLKEVEAMTEGEPLARGVLVRVVGVINGHVLLVERNSDRGDT